MGFPVAGLQSSYWYCCYLLPSQVQSYEPDTYHEIYMVSSLAKKLFSPLGSKNIPYDYCWRIPTVNHLHGRILTYGC